MNALAPPGGLRRGLGQARVANVELFFDLVFAFSITQLSHALLHRLDAVGALQTALLFLAVWWVWIYTAWVTNFIDPDRLATRLMLFAMMLGGLVLSMAVPEAFGERGLAFALAYVAMQIGRGGFMVWAIGPGEPALRRNFLRVWAWLLLAAPFWIAGGLAEGEWRLGLWLVALAIEFVSPFAYFWVPGLGRSTTRDWQAEGSHMAERCAGFVLIALGEGLLVTGASFAEQPWTTTGILAFLIAFLGSVGMWWTYFHIGMERMSEHFASAADRGRIARWGYTYLHLPIIGGIVIGAVADDLILTHGSAPASPATLACVVGGPALYLLGLALFKRIALGWLPLSHLVGLGALAALALAAPRLAVLPVAALAAATLLLVATWEHLSLRRGEA